MSVYTPLSHSQLALVLDSYGYRLLDFRAASHGIENSTFLIAKIATSSLRHWC